MGICGSNPISEHQLGLYQVFCEFDSNRENLWLFTLLGSYYFHLHLYVNFHSEFYKVDLLIDNTAIQLCTVVEKHCNAGRCTQSAHAAGSYDLLSKYS